MSAEQVAFFTYAEACAYAREHHTRRQIAIIHSPHQFNPRNSKDRMDYFIQPAGGMIRAWEKSCFEGLGGKAK